MSGTTLVRSVLTADSLMNDYLRAAREMSSRMSANDEEGFRVHLAEANRLYPAIWDQLDQARAAAVADGVPTADYDALRAERDTSTKAAGLEYDASEWEIDVLRSVATVGLAARKRISYELNLRGIELAKRGSNALRAAAPGLDWAGEKRALDALGNINVTSRNTAAMIKWAVIIGLAVMVAWIYSTVSSH
jgi:hypothetical protein